MIFSVGKDFNFNFEFVSLLGKTTNYGLSNLLRLNDPLFTHFLSKHLDQLAFGLNKLMMIIQLSKRNYLLVSLFI